MNTQEPRRTVVVAEDDFLVSREVVRAAEGAGLEVVATAFDGEQAVTLVKQFSPDVAVLDIDMPRLNGLDASRIICEELHVPVVVLTAYESAEFVKEAADAGVGSYLTKPPDHAALLRAVEIAVARHRDICELRRLNRELQETLSEVRILRGLLPVCSFCKRIRDEAGNWQSMHAYIARHSEAQVSDGLCPNCVREHYPEHADSVLERARAREQDKQADR